MALDGIRDAVFCGDGIDKVVADPQDKLNDCEDVEYGGVGRGWHW